MIAVDTTALALLAFGQTTVETSPFVPVEFATVERRIQKEPKYVGSPGYGLLILDPSAKVLAWAAFDKSNPELPYFDVLYFDRNANGDLTEAGERFPGENEGASEGGDPLLRFHVGAFSVPGTSITHTDLEFVTFTRAGKKGFGFNLKWEGKAIISCGHDQLGSGPTGFGTSVQNAPIVRPTTLGPLSFALYGESSGRVELRIGQEQLIKVMIGTLGSAPDTFCALSQDFLIAGKDKLLATLMATDRAGDMARVRTTITGRC
jgi:hypothetical protein